MDSRKEPLTMLIVGAGQMGQGIAQTALINEVNVILFDTNKEALASVPDILKKRLSKRNSANEVADAIKRLTLIENIDEAKVFDVAIEAASENQAIKEKIFKSIEALPQANDTFIFTNTSSISITEMTKCLQRPERFLGLHFMNPVPVIPLVEIIPHLGTSEAAIKLAEEICTTLKKTAVRCKDQPGFILNRLLIPYINQAIKALDQNLASAKDIDTAMTLGSNMPMGPLTLADFIGLDTCLAIMETLHKDFKSDPTFTPASLLKEMVKVGKLGRKSGEGFFSY